VNDTVTGVAAASRHACHQHALSQDFRILTIMSGDPNQIPLCEGIAWREEMILLANSPMVD
jgi:hypothetical protein